MFHPVRITSTIIGIILMNETLESWSFDPNGFPHLIGTKCRKCDHFHFPPAQTCRVCLADETEAVDFGREGTLYSYSIVHVASLGFEAPYAIGYVDLDHRIRLYTLLTKRENQEFRTGMKMELSISKIKTDEKGNDVTGYIYRPKTE